MEKRKNLAPPLSLRRRRQINKVERQVAKSFAYLPERALILLVESRRGLGKNDTLPGFLGLSKAWD